VLFDLYPDVITGGDLHTVPTSSLLAGHSPRLNGEDMQHVRLLAQSWTSLPPILVQRGTMRVIDGMHRLLAAELLGHATVDVRFFDGTDAEVLVAAVKANTGHGLALTLADRQGAAARIIALLPQRSDRWIAEVAGLSPGTVAALRRRNPVGEARPGTRVGRDGRERPVDISARRRMVKDAILQYPNASLRVIARMAGVSPGTVRDVRQRVRRGEDPVARPTSADGQRKQPGAVVRPESAGQRGRGNAVGQVRDRATLLRNLSKDPSLIRTDRGRKLLAWLSARAAGPSGLDAVIDTVPDHCLYGVAGLARKCADEWLEAARRLEQRLDGM
jgi:ParB-like chromosome segregation protein Spo0J